MTEKARPSESLKFPVSSTQKQIADIVAENAKGTSAGRYRAFNAILHLNKGWKLKDIDKEMALFRAITAEEEAATATFLALKSRQYDNASKLNHRLHEHKCALSSFIINIYNKLVSTELDIGKVGLSVDERNHLRLDMYLKDGKGLPIRPFRPTLPLEFELSESSEDGTMVPLNFRAYIANAVAAGGSTIEDRLKATANTRNQLIYAVDDGYPSAENGFEEAFERYKRNTFINLGAYLMIVQHKERQSFAQHALNSLLEVIGRLPPT